MPDSREELRQIGELAAQLLGRWVSIQNHNSSWRVLLFLNTDHSRQAEETRMIADCFDDLLGRLETIAEEVSATPDAKLLNALGNYLCAVRNSLSSCEHLTRLIAFHQKRQKFVGLFRVFQARHRFSRSVRAYLAAGAVLRVEWTRRFQLTEAANG